MSDTTTQVNIRLEAEDRAAEVIRSLKRDVDALSRSLRNLTQIRMPAFGTMPNMAAQAADALKAKGQALAAQRLLVAQERQASRQRTTDARTEDRQRRALEASALRDLRVREAANARAARQQLAGIRAVEQEERRAAAEAERRSNAVRSRHARDTRYLFGLRQRHDRDQRREQDKVERDTMRYGRQAWNKGRDAYADTTRPIGMTALAGTAATGAAARRILGAEADTDAAEINARSYGGLSEKAARALRTDWASPIAESLGTQTSQLITAWVDATKLGVPASGARAFAELATKTSSAWEVPFENVTDIFGTINTLLTSKGEEFSADRLKSVANALQHLAAKQSTTPEKLISFLQRGAGAAQVLGMSQEAGLAFGSASTSLGNQAGQSGRLFDYLASRIIELPRLTKRDGEEGDQARDLVKALGYTSAEQMDRQRRVNPDEFLPEFMSRFSNIKNQKKQDEAIRFTFGREWIGEAGRMIKGADTYREAVRLSKESKGLDAIGAVWDLHRLKLRFVFKQFRAGWLNILGEFGKVLSPMARDAGDYFLNWTSKLRAGGLQARFKASVDGLLEGLGFKNLPDLLQRVFGEPGQGAAGAIETWKATFREFGAGIRDVLDSFRSIVNVFTGGSPEAIARWTGRILTLSAALLVLSPVLTVLGGITTGLLALGSAAASVFTALKVAGLAGGAGAAGAIGTGVLATAGALIGTAFLATIANKLGILTPPDMSRGWGRGILEFLDPGLARRILGDEPKVERQSWNGAFDDRPMVTKASLITTELAAGLDRLGRALGATGTRVQLANLGASSSTTLGNFVGGGSSGGSGGGVPGFPGGSAPAVPGWFNRGGRSGGGNPANLAGPAGPVGERMKGVYQAFRNAGLGHDAAKSFAAEIGRENDYNPKFLYGVHRDPYNGQVNAGMMSWQKERATNLLAFMKAKGQLNPDGSMKQGQESLNAQAQFALEEMRNGTLKRGQHALNVLNDPKSTHAQRALTLGDDVIKWRQHDPRYASHATKRDRYYGQLGGLTEGNAAVPGAPSGAAANPGPLVGGVHPLDGKGRFTSDFGMRNHPKLGGWRMHKGIDLAAPGGTAVKSMKEGVVSIDRSGDVTVKHPDGSSTTYRHVNAGVEAGQKVAAGQQIATLRQNDPRSTGPHLHLEGRDANGKLIDPKGLLMPKGKEAFAEGMKPFTSSGWKPKAPGADSVPSDPGFTSSGWKPASAEDAIRKVPMPEPRSAVGGGGQDDRAGLGPASGSAMRAGASIVVHNNIQAGHQSPQEMAASIQRHVSEAWNYRAHDLEPELT